MKTLAVSAALFIFCDKFHSFKQGQNSDSVGPLLMNSKAITKSWQGYAPFWRLWRCACSSLIISVLGRVQFLHCETGFFLAVSSALVQLLKTVRITGPFLHLHSQQCRLDPSCMLSPSLLFFAYNSIHSATFLFHFSRPRWIYCVNPNNPEQLSYFNIYKPKSATTTTLGPFGYVP